MYSIATMLYQMLAGRTPFEGDSPVALLVQHTHSPPAELRSIARASYVPAPLAVAIMTNLSKKPGDRAQNARIFGRDLIAATRAGGLYPEEIATQSTLMSPASLGAVKLASKERTKAHELSAELASRIGGVAAVSADDARPHHLNRAPTPTLPSAITVAAQAPSAPEAADASSALPRSAPPPEASRPDATQIDFYEHEHEHEHATAQGPGGTVPGAPPTGRRWGLGSGAPGPLTTMQGTETTLDAPSSRRKRWARARRTRLAALVACVLVMAPVAILGGRRLGGFGAAPGDSVEGALDEARDCMRRHAWDAPPEHNFKEIIDRAAARWPASAAVAELRHEAAEKLLAEAVGRKYANDVPEATRLVQLALQLDPQLTTAQHLAAELSSARAPEVAPATVPVSSADRGGKAGHRGRDGKPDAKAPPPRGAVSGAPSTAPSPPPQHSGAVLPPPPTPKQPEPPPPAAPTGPWL